MKPINEYIQKKQIRKTIIANTNNHSINPGDFLKVVTPTTQILCKVGTVTNNRLFTKWSTYTELDNENNLTSVYYGGEFNYPQLIETESYTLEKLTDEEVQLVDEIDTYFNQNPKEEIERGGRRFAYYMKNGKINFI